MRYMSMYQTMKEIIDSGVIGDLKAVWVRHFVGLGGYYYDHDWHGPPKTLPHCCCQFRCQSR
ncbi:putative dehydrogenase [Neobacillus niacini]|nr:putative dehydrogenase [Neobacillus niacini]